MSKVRIYELAKETGLPNREVIRRLSELGITARSHSSTIESVDATRFRESLGQQREARRRAEEERARKEAEQYDLAAVRQAASDAKARRILPPHLRRAQEADQQSAPARRFRPPTTPHRPQQAPGVSVGGTAAPAEAPTPQTPEQAPAPVIEQPAAQAPTEPTAAAAQTAPPAADTTGTSQQPQPAAKAAEAARAGLVRAAPPAETRQPVEPQPQAPTQSQAPAARAPQRTDEEVVGRPGVPRPGTPPRPGQPTVPRRPLSPAATGRPVEPQRRVEHDLPKEGTGRRAIPPPVREAPKDRPPVRTPGRPSGPGGGPGGPAGPPGGPGGPAGRRKKGKKGRRKKEPTLQDQFEEQVQPRRRRGEPVQAVVEGPVDVVPGVTVSEFAKLINVNATDIVRVLFGMGEMITVTQSMSQDLIELVAAEMNADVNFVTPEDLEFGPELTDKPEDLQPRPPVVTVMGHVDHGKTLLLDAIRQTDVVSGEAGGITQHIGAYQVRHDGRAITFIDTPGHEAFTQMRARGAQVTDVAILVVAADDGVKPQTVEAIDHIRAAEVPIIVAVNKIDKETADPNRVRTQLTEYELIAEEFGGQTTMVDVSAKARQNLDELLEMVLLQADVSDLEANPNRPAQGAVIEANLDRGRGAVATVLVQTGTLRVGDNLVAGIADCKVRAMFADDGSQVTEAGPSRPVQVLGWSEVPAAGDEFRVVDDERTAREIAENRQARERRMELAERRTLSLEDLSGAIAEGKLETLNLIIKGDVAGSVEAVADAMEKLELPEVKIRIIRKGVGAVTVDDVNFAEASEAIVIAFNVRPEANARQAIDESGIDLRQYSVIYKAVEDIERAVAGMLAPEFEEVVTGRAEVREIFKIPRGFVFGCYVTEGQIRRGSDLRVIRDGVVVAEDRVASLRRFTEDVTEVSSGYECGIGLDRFQDIKVGDEFELYTEREIDRS
ncbi:MAG: translation initiation factor IF-2 [Actinobacteria bacterium]|nr:translation initiation factor IF-2 [Actinomycetota bacterium]